jgi:hypothetical protein
MYLVANSVASPGEVDAILGGSSLQVFVVVGVFETDLNGIVVDIANAQFRLYSGQAHRLELQVSHCASSILRQGLVDFDGHFLSRRPVPFHNVSLNNLLCYTLAHDPSSRSGETYAVVFHPQILLRSLSLLFHERPFFKGAIRRQTTCAP